MGCRLCRCRFLVKSLSDKEFVMAGNLVEIEAVGEIRFVHVKDKYLSDVARQRGFDAAYQLQLAFPKDGDVHRRLVAVAHELGVRANADSLRYRDGDLVTLRDGSCPQKGKWLVNLSSKWQPVVVDRDANEVVLDSEPGDGSVANVAFKIGSTKEGRLVYFLTGVQLLRVVERVGSGRHSFGVFVQQSTDDVLGAEF